MHTALMQIMSADANETDRKVRCGADAGSLCFGACGGLLCAPVQSVCNHFREPTASVRACSDMEECWEVDSGDPVCPLPAQAAKITVRAGLWSGRAARETGRLRGLHTTCVRAGGFGVGWAVNRYAD